MMTNIKGDAPNSSLPVDAHILPDYDGSNGVDVPVFVVAESTNIRFLMISGVYQRFVLSINEPLIGFETFT